MQLVLDDRGQRLEGGLIAAAPRDQQLGDWVNRSSWLLEGP
jgi:hypothetical protein